MADAPSTSRPSTGSTDRSWSAAAASSSAIPTRRGTSQRAGFAPSVGIDVYLGRKLSLGLDSQASIVGHGTGIDTWVSLGWTFGGR
jgi:hypothetical protein